jgi:hypothetical protein
MSLGCPLAITGVIGVAIPTSASPRTFGLNKATGEPELDIERHANVLHYGFAVEYSFIYLQEQVKDVGLHAPFDHLIPLVPCRSIRPPRACARTRTCAIFAPTDAEDMLSCSPAAAIERPIKTILAASGARAPCVFRFLLPIGFAVIVATFAG